MSWVTAVENAVAGWSDVARTGISIHGGLICLAGKTEEKGSRRLLHIIQEGGLFVKTNLRMYGITALVVVFVLAVGTAASASPYNESPMLKALVEAGELPPVEQRLPEEPLVVGPGTLAPEEHVDFEIGQYGGPLRMVSSTPEVNFDVYIMSSEPLLRGQGHGMANLQPNLVSHFEVTENNTVFTFTLRKGLKWSDGTPVTTEDVRFAIEDVMFNEVLTPVVPVNYRSAARAGGDPMELTIVDDYTFSLSFSEPYGGFVTDTSVGGWWQSYNALLKPSHYLKQYHIDYTPLEDMRAELEAEEFEDEWWQLFGLRDIVGSAMTRTRAIGFPTLHPWMRVDGPDGVMVFQRNPYFHKVDTAGNQLPYFDEIRSYEASDIQMVNMMVISGEADWLRDQAALTSMPLYVQNQERGGYEVLVLEHHLTPTVLKMNPHHEDETWSSLVNNLEFRRALNMAIDRQEIIDVAYFGMAEFPTLVPSEYDPEEANRILDSIGMDQRDSEGYRLAPNGEHFEFFVEYADMAADFVPVLELVAEFFSDVGVRTVLRQISWALVGQRIQSNEIMASMLWRSPGQWPGLVNTDYLPMRTWGAQWRTWFNTGGEGGIEPPDYVKELFDLHQYGVTTVPDTPENEAAVQAIFDWFYDNIPYFIMVERPGYPVLVNNRIRNVPTAGLAIDATYIGQQYFFAD